MLRHCYANRMKNKTKKPIRYEYNRSRWIEFPVSWSKFKTVFFLFFSTIINWCEKIIYKDVRHLLKERNERKHKKRGRIQKRNFFFFFSLARRRPLLSPFQTMWRGPATTAGVSAAESEAWNGHSVLLLLLLLLLLLSFIYYTAVRNRYSITHYT